MSANLSRRRFLQAATGVFEAFFNEKMVTDVRLQGEVLIGATARTRLSSMA
jgi:hypothetical protein